MIMSNKKNILKEEQAMPRVIEGKRDVFISYKIEEGTYIGDNTKIGNDCRIHRNVFIDKNVKIGNLVKIQNNNSIYEGENLEDGVFVGTIVTFINDRHPRAILKNGNQVGRDDWTMGKIHVCYGASIGAGSVIMCGKDGKELTIGNGLW